MAHTRFDQTLKQTIQCLQGLQTTQTVGAVVIIRDLKGRIRLVLDQAPQDEARRQFDRELAETLHQELGAFGHPVKEMILYRDELFMSETIYEATDLHSLLPDIRLLESQLIGQDWLRLRLPLDPAATAPRVTFYGLKGGVGRSSALVAYAWHLAGMGKKVMVVDLDLESPGLGAILLPRENTPAFGVIDWLVEDQVDQADAELIRDMVGRSPLGERTSGEIRTVPAFGLQTGDYFAKLGRGYLLNRSLDGGDSFAHRLQRMLLQLEAAIKPDVILLDSRAGLHDLAAASITRLGAEVLLFAVHSEQTWQAYRILFNHWMRHPQPASFRERLHFVAAMVPETSRQEYLNRFRESAYQLFADTLYEEESGHGPTRDLFNFDFFSAEAPHQPMQILWRRELQEFDPIRREENVSIDGFRGAFGDLLDKLTPLIFGDTE